MINKSEMPDVLVVDDVPANLVAMKRLLKNLPVNVVTANGGFEALELTINHDFALVLLDVQMPEIDGYETAEMMKSTEHSKHLPIIFVTANSTAEENIMKGYAVGAVDYLTKPVNGEILREKTFIFVELFNQKKQLIELNADLLEAQKEAEKLNQLKSDFLANMSHELRTPIHAMVGFCELGIMSVEQWDNSDHIENLEEIKDSGGRLLSLVNNLLDLSKLESGVIELNFNKNDLLSIIHSSAKSLMSLVEEKNQILNIVGESTFVSCDDAKIYQVIVNFISNSIKFSPIEQEINVEVKSLLTDDMTRAEGITFTPAVMVTISDKGVGIPKDELKTVFDKFIQSSKTKTGAGGTGLGLAICKEIIDEHGGKIWTENIPEGGCRFSFALPLMPFLENVND